MYLITRKLEIPECPLTVLSSMMTAPTDDLMHQYKDEREQAY
jgi:hypothetical protein